MRIVEKMLRILSIEKSGGFAKRWSFSEKEVHKHLEEVGKIKKF